MLVYNLATIYAQEKDFQQAIDLFRRSLQLNPNLTEAWYNLGSTRFSAGQRDEVIKDLNNAGELGLYDAYSVMKVR